MNDSLLVSLPILFTYLYWKHSYQLNAIYPKPPIRVIQSLTQLTAIPSLNLT